MLINKMVPRNGFEPSTVRVWTVCSSQLSYLGINGGDKRDRTADLRSASASLSQTELYPHMYFGAGNETRTRDPNLGKVMLYQLSYSRKIFMSVVRRERLELSRLGH